MTDDSSERDAPPPKLTLGQRVLTALPNLQARRAEPPVDEDAGESADTGPGDETGVEDDEGASGGSSATTATTRGRLRDRPAKPAPAGASRSLNPYTEWPREQISNAMKYLDARERRLALMAGPLLIALNITLTFVTLHNNHRLVNGHLNKAYENPSTIIALGVGSAVVAAIVVVSGIFRRRSFTIFALLFAGYGGGPVTLLPSWALAGWLFVRFNRMQKALRMKDGGGANRAPARARGASKSRVPSNPRAAARAGAAAGRDRRSGARARGRKEPVPAGPTPSKRYTPPKPPRPRPPAPPS